MRRWLVIAAWLALAGAVQAQMILGPPGLWSAYKRGAATPPGPYAWDTAYDWSKLLCEFDSNADPAPDTSYIATNRLFKAAGSAAPTYVPATGGVSGCWSYDGTADYHTNTSMTGFSSTKGAIMMWVRADPAAANIDRYWSFCTYADFSGTNYSILTIDSNYSGPQFDVLLQKNGATKWSLTRNAGVLTAASGWNHIVLTHNGTEPTLWVNSKTQAVSWVVTTDKTLWTKAILTDATYKADHFSIGGTLYDTAFYNGFTGQADRPTVYTNAITSAQVATNFWRTATNHGWTAWDFQNRTGLYLQQALACSFNYASTGADQSTNGLHMTLGSGASAPTWQASGGSNPNGWFYFDGSNDGMGRAYDARLAFTDSFTFSAWVYSATTLTAQADFAGIIGGDDGDPAPDRYILTTTAETLRFGFYDATATAIYTDTPTLTGFNSAWKHLACMFDNSANTLSVYVNAVLVTNKTSVTQVPRVSASQPVYIGCRDQPGGVPANVWKGRIDEVRMWPVALTAAQVTNLYTGTLGGHP